jgi:hypothetical protein
VVRPRLFHFSERDDIEIFQPKPVDVPSTRDPGEEWLNGPLVWAVEETRQAAYCFPRDCPRILLWPTATTSAADLDAWWGDRTCSMIAHVEWRWLERLRDQSLSRYALPSAAFRQTRDEWMWVADEPVVPSTVDRLDDLLSRLQELNVELRIMESLVPLRLVWDTTLHASGIRLRNAQGWYQR